MDWKLVRAADFIDFNPRESIKKGTMAKKVAMEQLQPFTRDIPAYEIAPFNGGSKFRNGDTLMARITPCLENGKTAQVNILEDGEIGFGSTEFIVLRAKPGVSDKNFIYYLAMSPILRDKAIKSMVGSSGRQRVQQGVMNDIEFLAPPIKEQIEIGRTLRALDDKITNNSKINHHLASLRSATDSSPDIRRGRSESLREARWLPSLDFISFIPSIGFMTAEKNLSAFCAGITIGILVKSDCRRYGKALPSAHSARWISSRRNGRYAAYTGEEAIAVIILLSIAVSLTITLKRSAFKASPIFAKTIAPIGANFNFNRFAVSLEIQLFDLIMKYPFSTEFISLTLMKGMSDATAPCSSLGKANPAWNEHISPKVPSRQSSGITPPNGSKSTNHDLKMACAICSK